MSKVDENTEVYDFAYVPDWVNQDITVGEVEAVNQGGCASGAYMPAVTYYHANKTMAKHGDDVLDYIEEALGEVPAPRPSESWSGMACHYLSCAVELWCSAVWPEIEERMEEEDDE